jgi:MFS family permease
MPVALGAVAPISGSLSDRFGTRAIALIGLCLVLVGYYALNSLTIETGVLGYILRLLPLGIGMGVFQSPNNSAIMGSVSREYLGVTSGLLSITRTMGQTIGIAMMGALWAARTATHAGGLLSGGVTTAPTSAQIAGLQDSFLGALLLIVVALLLSLWGFTQARRLGERVSGQVGRVS